MGKFHDQQLDLETTQQLLGVAQPLGAEIVARALFWSTVIEKPAAAPWPFAVIRNVFAVNPLQANVKLDVAAGHGMFS
jgi:hypothetical protein